MDVMGYACGATSLSLCRAGRVVKSQSGLDCRALPMVAAGSLATPLIADDVGEKAMEV